MKRIILSILSFLYLSAATGTSLHFHYCMGNLDSWCFMKVEKKECQECGMQKNTSEDIGCCSDEYKQLKLQVDQTPGQHAFGHLSVPHIELYTSFHNYYPLSPKTTSLFLSCRCSALIERTNIATYILLCTLRI